MFHTAHYIGNKQFRTGAIIIKQTGVQLRKFCQQFEELGSDKLFIQFRYQSACRQLLPWV